MKNTKMDQREMCEDVEKIHLALDSEQWWVIVNMAMKFRVL